MKFSVEFYVTESGKCPVEDFLEDLRQNDPDDHAAVMAELNRMKNRQNHRRPLSRNLEQGLFELRHVGKLNTRILWAFAPGKRIILLHGIRNKGKKIHPAHKQTALKRLTDWAKRNDA